LIQVLGSAIVLTTFYYQKKDKSLTLSLGENGVKSIKKMVQSNPIQNQAQGLNWGKSAISGGGQQGTIRFA